MTIATSEERTKAARLLKIHKRNLERLEEQKAKLAGEVNLGIENQMDEERANIAALEPIANPPPLPSPKVAEFVKQTTPQDIDNTMLFMQGVQLNARMTKAEEQNQHIIEEQSRASIDRMQTKDTIDGLVVQVSLSEQARKLGARWYRRAIVGALAMALLALLVASVALIR